MSTMISEVYDAFVSAGAPEDKARRAAEAVASYEHRFVSVEQKLISIQGDLNLLKWMVGALIGIGIAVGLKTFLP